MHLYAEVKLVRTHACGKEDSRVVGCALRWHTTHRSGTSAMRVSRGATRHTSQKSTLQLRQLLRSLAYTGVVTGVVIILMLCIVTRSLGVVIVVRD